ncbi:MAG: ATP-binding cassette domain-containing protein [Cytophagales bacterium]|nr:ATP-binding cassette domain-containing protein [Cytophagales bacterium]
MSDNLLKTILRLLEIVAREDDVTSSEREAVQGFLEENVSKEETLKYMEFFDKLLEGPHEQDQRDETKEIIKLSYQVNKELKQEQKLVVMLRLLELIIADGKVSEREKELLYLIGNSMNFATKVLDHLKSFVTTDEPEKYAAKSVLVVSAEETELKAHHIQVARLNGFLAFFNVPGIDIYFVKYKGDDGLSLNGQGLRPGSVKVFSNGSSIRGRNVSITPIYFSDVISGFHESGQQHKLSFVADHVDYKFSNGNKGLTDFNLAEQNGKLIGIMGGSGSGKSTLLNVLNGNESPSAGSVRINGIDIHKDAKSAEGIIGYVPQDDLLIEELTVHQNLFFAAKLCFSQSSEEELNQLVNKVLTSLGLKDTSDLKVGNPLQKTISGGQRKRLNIGLELLREPSVLFVDEPTSGLSSRDSENIMDLLKELSLKGKMIFVVIHQPSSDIFKMFDKLVILDVGGFQIYYGNPVDGVTYFKTIVDHIDKDQAACINCGNVNPEQIFNIIETKVVDEYGRFTQVRKISPAQWHEFFKEKHQFAEAEDINEAPPKSLSVPSRFKQLGVFIKRDILSKLSNRQYLFINMLEAPVLALLLAYIVRYSPVGSEYTFNDNLNIPVFFFISIIVALFMGLTISAEEIIKDRLILKRESFLNLSRMSYLSSKVSILFFVSAVQTLLFTVLGVWILEIQGMTFNYWMILFSVSCFANMLGLNISASFNSVVTIYILIPLLIIPQLMLSGVVVNFDKLNATLTTEDKVPIIGEVMASRWAYEALAVAQFKENSYNQSLYDYNRRSAQAEYKSIYYIPELEKIAEKALSSDTPETSLALLNTEIGKELQVVGANAFDLNRLKAGQYNEAVHKDLKEFLDALRKFYNNRRNKASDEKEKFLTAATDTEKKKNAFINLRNAHENERIAYMLKNTSVEHRVVRSGDELVQKIYPIYAQKTNPKHPFDFRANFYFPEKHFLGMQIPTKTFNLLVIWFMTVTLFVTLYFNVLRKLITKGSRR